MNQLTPEDQELIRNVTKTAEVLAGETKQLAKDTRRNRNILAAAVLVVALGGARYTGYVACSRSNVVAAQMSNAFKSAAIVRASVDTTATTTTTSPATAENTRRFFADFGRQENCGGLLP